MARPIERPKHHYKPFEFTINVEDAFDYLDKFKNTPDYPKTFPLHVPNKYKILGDRLESKFGVSTVEARKIVGMWFDRNKNIKTENMKKVIKLNEKSLESLVNKIIKEEKIQEALPRRERERHETNWRKKNFEPYDRERDIMGAFGPYSSDVPPNVISYLRKNPRTFLQRVVDIYGMDKVLDFIGYQQPEMTEGYHNYMEDDEDLDMNRLMDTAYGLGYNLSDDLADVVDMYPNQLEVIVDEFNRAIEETATSILGIDIKASVIMGEGYDSYMDDVHEEEKWIQKAIERPGSLRRKMGVKKGEKLSPADIKAKMKSLEAKDKDPNKSGVQGLGKSDLRTYRQLNLAKTLRGLK